VQGPSNLSEIDPEISRLIPEIKPVFCSFLEPLAVTTLINSNKVGSQRICALAAIANPEGFFKSLEILGFDIVKRFVFPDHHHFKGDDLVQILAEFPDLVFVCTSKDAVKLREFPDDIQSRFAVLSVAAQVSPSDAFFEQVERAIKRHKLTLQITRTS
jgi:tetraacyldisaccharide-1-P 4'-kinase